MLSLRDRLNRETAESMSGVLTSGFLPAVNGRSIESKKGRRVDALAHRGDEGRDKLR